MNNISLEASWKQQLLAEFSKPYMQELKQFLLKQKQLNKVIYPKGADIFRAFNLTPFDQVKVVIVGQDPYHGPNQAHGLCFSVQPKVTLPPSLVNIYKELEQDLGIKPAAHGCLTSWAEQGVLLLNSTLTVERSAAGSHQGKGWEEFTDRVIDSLNCNREGIVFLLWGNYAKRKGAVIDANRHFVLEAAHPSPFSARNGFFGCRHFSKTNKILGKLDRSPINWQLTCNR
jgi:uracil-DNA glycosylase